MEVPAWALAFTSIAQTPTSKIARSHGTCTFSCRDTMNPLPMAVLYSFSYPRQRLMYFFFLFLCFLLAWVFLLLFLLEAGSRAVPAGFKPDIWTKMSLCLSSSSFCLPRTGIKDKHGQTYKVFILQRMLFISTFNYLFPVIKI